MAQTHTHTTSNGMDFMLITPGKFLMGSPVGQGFNSEHPQCEITITKPFYLQVTPVTQVQWYAVMKNNPSHFRGKHLPVECVSWNDVHEFLRRLNEKESGHYRLPTEAEWEYACRAGTTTRYYFGDDVDKLREYCWYYENSYGRTRSVGQKRPNAWGLHDMHGNVWEWCSCWYDKNYYANIPGADPIGPSIGSRRVVRGGSWYNYASAARSANRFSGNPLSRFYSLGFRCVREAD